jgi:NAD-specific glutamate dehydrogenase
MLSRVGELIAEIKNNPPPLPVDEIAEATQFSNGWSPNNFTFLGVREYALTGAERGMEALAASGLGILRAPEMHVLRRGEELVAMTPEIMEFLKEPKALIITKANVRSRVHRRVHMDYIGVKRFDSEGHLIGEFRIVGLFTSTAYTRPTRSIPYLRRKVDALMRRSGFDPDRPFRQGVRGRCWSSYSRDELFQIDEDTLFGFVLAIMHLDERPRVRVLARRDRFDRFVSIMVFVPRERYDSSARIAIGTYLAGAYRGRVAAFYPFFPEGPLVRVHFIIARVGGETPNPDRRRSSGGRAAGAHLDRRARRGAHAGPRARSRRSSSSAATARRFPLGYREAYAPPASVADIRLIETLSPIRPLGAVFYSRQEGDLAGAGLKVWSREKADPALRTRAGAGEHGLHVVDERTYRIEPGESGEVWLHDMMLQRADAAAFDLEALKARLEATFMAVMRRPCRERRLQRAGADRGRAVARRRAGAHDLALPAPGARCLLAGLHVGDAAAPLRHHVADRAAVPSALRSAPGDHEGRARRAAGRAPRRDRKRARRGGEPRRGPHPAPFRQCGDVGAAHQLLPARRRAASRRARSRSSSTAARSTACRCRSRSTRSSSIRRASKACTCASARSRAAASAGPTGRRISAPRCSAWSRRSRSRMP